MKVKPGYVRLKDGYHAIVDVDGVLGMSDNAHFYKQDAVNEADYAARNAVDLTGAELDGDRRKSRRSYTVKNAPMRTSGMTASTSNRAMFAFGLMLTFACLSVGIFALLYIK